MKYEANNNKNKKTKTKTKKKMKKDRMKEIRKRDIKYCKVENF